MSKIVQIQVFIAFVLKSFNNYVWTTFVVSRSVEA